MDIWWWMNPPLPGGPGTAVPPWAAGRPSGIGRDAAFAGRVLRLQVSACRPMAHCASVASVVLVLWGQRVREAWRRIDRRLLDGALAAIVTASIWLALATKPLEPGQNPTTAAAYVSSGAACLALAFHRRHPLWAAAVMDVAVVAYSLGRYSAFPGFPVFVLVFLVALGHPRRIGLPVAAGAAVTMVVAILAQPGTVATGSVWVATILAVAVAWLLGENQRGRRARWAALEERARMLEAEREERDRQAIVQERLRIARELHDVVAHAMSVVAVQSGVGRHVIDRQPETAKQALATIELTSRQALVEMRRLLGVLRDGEEPRGALSPAPGLADVPALVDRMRASGLDIALTLDVGQAEPADEPPPGVALSAYRVVQEGLTNVLRHGGGRAEVLVRSLPGAVTVEVADDGGRPGARRPAAVAGSGHGLIGLRERVAVFGGELTAGARPGGGFLLRACLPYPARATTGAATGAAATTGAAT